jgi:hypothetical protein
MCTLSLAGTENDVLQSEHLYFFLEWPVVVASSESSASSSGSGLRPDHPLLATTEQIFLITTTGTYTIVCLSDRVVEPEPRKREPKLNCLSEPEPKLQIAAPASAPALLYLSQT